MLGITSEWANFYATLIGSLATFSSVVVATITYLRNERRKKVGQIRVDAETARGLFSRIDRSISSSTFLLASEQFKNRLDKLVGPEKTRDSILKLLKTKEIKVNLTRLTSQSLSSVQKIDEINRNIQEFKEICVRIGQLYPVSSYTLSLSVSFTENFILRIVDGTVINSQFSEDYIGTQISHVESTGDTYEVIIEDLSSIVDFIPLSILEEFLQKSIDDTAIIIDNVCNLISQSEDSTLFKLAHHERSIDISIFKKKGKIAEAIQESLQVNRKYFSESSWDRVWEAKARLMAAGAQSK